MIEDKTTQEIGGKIFWLIGAAALLVLLGTVNNIFSYLALILCAAVILYYPNAGSLYLLVFLVSFANIFKPGAGAQSFYTYLWLLYILVQMLRSRTVYLSYFILIIVFAAFLWIGMDNGGNLFRMIKLIANMLFLYYAVGVDVEKQHRNIFLCYILGVVLASLVAWLDIFPNVVNYIGEKELEITYDHQARFAGMYADPNCYSVNLIISLCLLICMFHRRSIKLLPALVLTGFILLFSVLTYSKSTILMLLLPMILLLYSQAKKRKFFIFGVLAIAMVVIVFNAVAGNIPFLQTVISRFTSSTDMAELTTGRSTLWEKYMTYLGENSLVLLFGVGIDANVLGRAVHNTYIDMLYYLGITGSMLFISLFAYVSRICATGGKKNLLNNSVWLTIAIMYFFLSLLFYFDWPIHIFMAIMVRNLSLEKDKML